MTSRWVLRFRDRFDRFFFWFRCSGHIQTTMLKSLDFAEDSLTMISTEARNKEAAERQQDRAAFVSNALGETWPKQWRTRGVEKGGKDGKGPHVFSTDILVVISLHIFTPSVKVISLSHFSKWDQSLWQSHLLVCWWLK